MLLYFAGIGSLESGQIYTSHGLPVDFSVAGSGRPLPRRLKLKFVAEPLLVAVAILAGHARRAPKQEHLHEELPGKPLVEELRENTTGSRPRSSCAATLAEDAQHVQRNDWLPNEACRAAGESHVCEQILCATSSSNGGLLGIATLAVASVQTGASAEERGDNAGRSMLSGPHERGFVED